MTNAHADPRNAGMPFEHDRPHPPPASGSADDPFVAAVDWGTTRLRIWILDRNGRVLADSRSDDGLISTAPDDFEPVLERRLGDLGVAPGVPAVICGMAGARQGWIEAPYFPLPAKLDAVLSAAISVPARCRPVRIIPGLAQCDPLSPDVLRGEETQLAGAARRLAAGEHLICLPGTHSKWARLSNGVVTEQRTFLTGELFSVLSQHSILRHTVDGTHSVSAANPVFREWLARLSDRPEQLVSLLFAIRASGLLFDLGDDDAAAALSGLLIGAEIGNASRHWPTDGAVVLVASGVLGDLYGEALLVAGYAVQSIDADEAVMAGLLDAARRLFPDDDKEQANP